MNTQQSAYAQQIVAAVKAAGLSQKAAVIAIETAITESGLQLYANSNVPESLNYPHSNVGSDHDSLGLFQQQTPGWGNVKDLMNPTYDTTRFINALKTKSDWANKANWVAAQDVQNSAWDGSNGKPYGANYRANDAQAQKIVAQFWNAVPGASASLVDTAAAPSTGINRTSTPTVTPSSGSTAINAAYMQATSAGNTEAALSVGGIPIPNPLPFITGLIPGYADVKDAIGGLAQGFSYVAQFFSDLLWIFEPGHFLKVILYINGVALVIVGIVFVVLGAK